MLKLWELPKNARIGGKSYCLNCDFRDILEIFSYFDRPELPDFVKWRIALRLFYGAEIPPEDRQEAMTYFTEFISMGQGGKPAPRLMSWDHDAPIIIGEVNRVAGREIREMPFLHWWTFLSWFHAIGEGQLSTLVSIREKLRAGKKLEKWEQEYYRKNRDLVTLRRQYTPEELAEQEKLKKLLDS
jgi:hypothetical protein